MVNTIASLVRNVGVLVGGVILGIVVPLAWVWLGAQVQGGTAPSLSAIFVVLMGILLTYAALVVLFAVIRARAMRQRGPVRHSWTRSMRDTPGEAGGGHWTENVAVVACLVTAIVAAVLFFVAGDPGAPPT